MRWAPLAIASSLALAGACMPAPPHAGPAWVSVVGAPGTSATAVYAYVTGRGSPDGWSHAQIHLMDATGKVDVDVTNDASSNAHPTLSPDGRRIAFAAFRDDGPGIFAMDLDGGAPVRVTANVQATAIAWSPLGPIAYEARVGDGRTCVWTVDEGGDGRTRITEPSDDADDDGGLAFVDGGRTIVFSRYDRATHDRDLWSVAADGSGDPVRITATPATSETAPVASPDGRLLAYRASHSGPNYAYDESITLVAVGSWALVRDLPLPPPIQWNVSGIDFTPDGRSLVFGADATDVGGSLENVKGEIFVFGLDGANLVRLTRNAAYDGQPISLRR